MSMHRLVGLLALVLAAPVRATPVDAGAPLDAAGPTFHLEGPPAIDDVFGDSSAYRRDVDRFLALTTRMQAIRDQFATAVQTALTALTREEAARHRRCPVDRVAGPYARALKLGAEYLQIGRELTRHYDEVKEFDRLGESVGLTPDYRWKVRRVLNQYDVLLTGYREMKVAFHDQLEDELKYAGCDPKTLLAKGDPRARPGEEWPQPGTPGAPGVPAVPIGRAESHETLPPSLPAERLPPAQPIAVPRRPPAPADPTLQPSSGMLFYVDNTRCARSTSVWLDGKKLGEVPAGQRVGFQTVPGPHDLCLLDDASKTCGAPGTVRRSYFHEGWSISLRCE